MNLSVRIYIDIKKKHSMFNISRLDECDILFNGNMEV